MELKLSILIDLLVGRFLLHHAGDDFFMSNVTKRLRIANASTGANLVSIGRGAWICECACLGPVDLQCDLSLRFVAQSVVGCPDRFRGVP